MNALACNLCKEPAWNFLCMECVAKDVTEFLPHELVDEFRGFHEYFYNHFDSPQLVLNGAVYCVNCRSTKESPVCPNCYANEVQLWLDDKDSGLAVKFARMFNFGGQASIPFQEEAHTKEDFGICDECGEYTDELAQTAGEWVCRECRFDDE